MDDDPVRQRILQVDDRIERVVLDVDGIERIAGLGVGPGEHDRDPVADVVHLVHGQRVVRRVLHVLGDRPRARHRCGPQVGQLGAGEHLDDAGQTLRRRRVDRRDAGVGERAAQDGHVQRAGQDEVIGEAGLAGEQGRVLPAQHARCR